MLARHVRVAAKEDPRSGALAKAWGDVGRRFARELEPHFRAEEEHLLPQLAAAGAQALAERARKDHARLRELVRGAPSVAAATEFAERLHGHVRFEERELFPRAELVLSEAELEAAGRAALAARSAPSAPQ